MSKILKIFTITLFLILSNTLSFADDSQTLDSEHWEIDFSTSGNKSSYGWNILLPSMEIDYGATDNVQLHLAVPLGLNSPPNGKTGYTADSIEVGTKLNIWKQDEDNPGLAIYPIIEIPMGNPNMNFSTGYLQVFLPLWIEKSFGNYRIFGGGGYWVNPGKNNRNYVSTSIDLRYKVQDDFEIGPGIIYQSWNNNNYKSELAVNLNILYDITDRWHLFGSAGTGIMNRNATNQFSYSLGVKITL